MAETEPKTETTPATEEKEIPVTEAAPTTKAKAKPKAKPAPKEGPVLVKVDLEKTDRREATKGYKYLQQLANHEGKTLAELKKLDWFKKKYWGKRNQRDIKCGAVVIK